MAGEQKIEAPLEGKVAQVLSERELVINIGLTQGVKRDMKFAVLADRPIEIRDPDTQSVLGVIDRPKVKVKATTVDDNLTICSTYEVTVVGVSAFDAMSALFPQPRREVVDTLRADDKSRPKPLTPEESYVKIGDRVKQIVG